MFSFLTKVRNFISGYKTYLLCAATILTVLVAWASGNLSDLEALKALGTALGAITLRAAIAKVPSGTAMIAALIGFAAWGHAAYNAEADTVTNRPVSGAITNTINSISGASVATPTTVSEAAGQLLNAGYLYVATNGQVSAGVGNTLRALGEKKFAALMTESVDLPEVIPSNGVVNVIFEIVTSQLYASDKTHAGLGLGVYTLWHVGWLQKLHLGPLQNLQGIELGAFIAPDIDTTAALKFSQNDTVAGAKAGLKWTF